jgi:hypothetical protein
MGDTLTRCLRIVHYPSPNGYHVFDKVCFVPVEKTDFQTVAIEVLTKFGDKVPFPDSTKPLLALLHFRPRI